MHNKISNNINIEGVETPKSNVIDFDFLETIIPELSSMRPSQKKIKANFLNSIANKASREDLLVILDLWEEALESNKSVSEVLNYISGRMTDVSVNYNKNLEITATSIRDLEKSYTSTALFYDNAKEKEVHNLTILNADMDQIKDLDDTSYFEAVENEINSAYDRLDLRENYSLLVIPGYLGDNKVLEKWSGMVHNNKVLLITDFEHLDTPDDIVEFFESANHIKSDVFLSNTIMTCNWLVGRSKYDNINESDDLYIPPSTSLAGKIYSAQISQASAGNKFGVLNRVDGVRFALKKNDLAVLERLGLIPMFYENGEIIAFSAKTLFNGDNLGLQTYSVVRVFDYVSKVLMDYLNRRTFENFNTQTRREIMNEIVKFLDNNTGPDKLIESFSIKRLERDTEDKRRIHLDVHMEPYFPAKNFLIRMDGKVGGEGNVWESFYFQSS